MAETSALCFSPLASIPSISRSREPFSFLSAFTSSHKSLISHSRPLRFAAKASSDSGNFFGDDSFGFFPWNDGDSEIRWVPEERVTLFTADGLIQIGGSLVPRRVSSSEKKQGRSRTAQGFQRFQESDYMDPEQGLCLGALFDIAATNGLDMGRRLCIFGFCRSIEMLSDVVEDTVLEHGGEPSADLAQQTTPRDLSHRKPIEARADLGRRGGTRARIGALCDRSRPRSEPDEAVDDELMIEGGAVGLELGCAVMVGLWVCLVCGFAGFVGLLVCGFAGLRVCCDGGLRLIIGGLRWWVYRWIAVVVAAEKATKGGLHEKLTMTVAVPLLWGVPPASETLHLAVQSGGGIVEKQPKITNQTNPSHPLLQAEIGTTPPPDRWDRHGKAWRQALRLQWWFVLHGVEFVLRGVASGVGLSLVVAGLTGGGGYRSEKRAKWTATSPPPSSKSKNKPIKNLPILNQHCQTTPYQARSESERNRHRCGRRASVPTLGATPVPAATEPSAGTRTERRESTERREKREQRREHRVKREKKIS
uniref:DUF7811 domain-containing protein n=1 Tax=Fagus sylvatica TaxID=28930 RepID=A0A2N9GLR5_FAGSY